MAIGSQQKDCYDDFDLIDKAFSTMTCYFHISMSWFDFNNIERASFSLRDLFTSSLVFSSLYL